MAKLKWASEKNWPKVSQISLPLSLYLFNARPASKWAPVGLDSLASAGLKVSLAGGGGAPRRKRWRANSRCLARRAKVGQRIVSARARAGSGARPGARQARWLALASYPLSGARIGRAQRAAGAAPEPVSARPLRRRPDLSGGAKAMQSRGPPGVGGGPAGIWRLWRRVRAPSPGRCGPSRTARCAARPATRAGARAGESGAMGWARRWWPAAPGAPRPDAPRPGSLGGAATLGAPGRVARAPGGPRARAARVRARAGGPGASSRRLLRVPTARVQAQRQYGSVRAAAGSGGARKAPLGAHWQGGARPPREASRRLAATLPGGRRLKWRRAPGPRLFCSAPAQTNPLARGGCRDGTSARPG